VKLSRVEITGFRGTLPTLPLELDEKSLVLYGENGFGKSTIADALELWSHGDVAAFHKAGCKLDAAVHVDAGEASVEIQAGGMGPLRRTLAGTDVGPLEVIEGVADPDRAEGLPLLRHETVRDFMLKSGGDKKRELLALVGLESLNDFRDELRSARTEAKRGRETVDRDLQTEQERLEGLCGEQSLIEAAEELRKEARLPDPINSEEGLRDLEMQVVPVGSPPDRLGAVEALGRACTAASQADTADWNALVEDRAAVEQHALAALVKEGRSVMEHWSEDECPLCASEYPREQLSIELEQRVADLAEIEGRFEAAGRQLGAVISAWRDVAAALERVLARPPDGGWDAEDKLTDVKDAADGHLKALEAAVAGTEKAPAAPDLLSEPELAPISQQAASAVSPETKALLKLDALKRQLEARSSAQSGVKRASEVELTVKRLLEIADEKIEAAINEAIGELGELVGRYFLTLSGSTVYSDVKLVYDSKRAGEAEFSVVYDKRETSKPPQRIMSNGQLNGLALAFFLARLKHEDQHWQTVVLDDVVSSFGGAHRSGLLDLLASEFPEWQVILLTHDRTFALLAQKRLGGGWEHWQITQWTPTGGPVLAQGEPLARLKERLEQGDSASELGSIARQALESELARPLEKLRYPIEYHSNGVYTGMDYLIALRKGLTSAKSPLAEEEVLGRMEADTFITNIGSHYQPELGEVEASDLSRLLADLEEVRSIFRCGDCNEQVWAMGDRPRKHTCRCKALAA